MPTVSIAVASIFGFVALNTNSANAVRLSADDETQAHHRHVKHFVRRFESSPAEKQKFETAPAGTAKNLFVPAKHLCDQKKLDKYLKEYPSQANHTEKQARIQTALSHVHDALNEVGLPTILEGGSTLGFYRNCGVIPSDADGDVALLGNWLDDDKVEEIKHALQKRNGGSLGRSMCPKGPKYTGCEMRASFKDNSYVDLMVYSTENECTTAPCKFYSPIWPGGEVGETFAPCTTGNVHFEQAIFLDRTFWIQAPTNTYLALEYGPKWKDPESWGKDNDCGIYRNCNFKEQETPKKDSFAETIPPAKYVLSLQPGNVTEMQLSLLEYNNLDDGEEKPPKEASSLKQEEAPTAAAPDKPVQPLAIADMFEKLMMERLENDNPDNIKD